MKKLDPDKLRAHKGKSFVGITTAVAIFNLKGQLFMAQRSNNARDEHGRWDICAGGLKLGEKIENNVRREMEEEFGVVTNELLHPIGIREVFRTDQFGDKTHWVCHDHIVVLTDVEAAKVDIKELDMFNDSGWFDLGNLPSPLHPAINDELIIKFKKSLSVVLDKA